MPTKPELEVQNRNLRARVEAQVEELARQAETIDGLEQRLTDQSADYDRQWSEAVRKAVEEFPEGCLAQKNEFLAILGIDPIGTKKRFVVEFIDVSDLTLDRFEIIDALECYSEGFSHIEVTEGGA